MHQRAGLPAIVALTVVLLPALPAHGASAVRQQLEDLIATFVRQRGAAEGITGAVLRVEGGRASPAIEIFAGNDGRSPAAPLTKDTLYQIGSNTKHFEAALILRLEAEGKLRITDRIGQYLPQYPAWKTTTIQSLLNMTSGLPNYSETPAIGQAIVADTQHQFSLADLIAAVYPGTRYPRRTGYFYSNTNNVLAAMIVEKVTGQTFKDALATRLLRPLHLTNSFYEPAAYPPAVLDRLPSGRYENAACLLYDPEPCHRSTLAPLIGHDMRLQNLSWAGPAGAMISTLDDLALWVHALFSNRVLPRQQFSQMTSLVSQKTGLPITGVSAAEPRGFALDLGRIYDVRNGQPFWFYQGDTLGFRTAFAYWPQFGVLITGATNSQPPDGADDFAREVFGKALAIARGSDK